MPGVRECVWMENVNNDCFIILIIPAPRLVELHIDSDIRTRSCRISRCSLKVTLCSIRDAEAICSVPHAAVETCQSIAILASEHEQHSTYLARFND